MNLLTRNSVPILAILLSVGASLAILPALPARIPVHWGIDGSIVAWAPRDPGAFLIPGAMACVLFFFTVLPYIDKGRTRQLREVRIFEPLRNAAILLFAYAHVLSLGISLGYISEHANYLAGAASLLVLLVGDSASSFPAGRCGTLLSRLGPSSLRLTAGGVWLSGLLGMVGTATGKAQIVWLAVPLLVTALLARLGPQE